MNQKQINKLTLLQRLDNIRNLIEVADNRALAVDGPVGHVRDNLTDKEWRELYLCSVVPDEMREQGKQIKNQKELEAWLRARQGKNFYSIKAFIEGVFYEAGDPVKTEVNVAWICAETGERFALEWE